MFSGLGLMAMTDGGGGIGRTASDLGVATISSGGALIGSPAASSYSAGTGGVSAAAGAGGDGGALSSPAISSAAAGLTAGPFGEGGPYTPIDYPAMRFLGQGESLANMQVKSGQVQPATSTWPLLALALGVVLLLKD